MGGRLPSESPGGINRNHRADWLGIRSKLTAGTIAAGEHVIARAISVGGGVLKFRLLV